MDNLTKEQVANSDSGAPGGRTITACNATPGTGIAQAISASYDATKALVAIESPDAWTVGAALIVPHWIRLINTVAPASGTSANAAITLTAGGAVTGGTVLTGRSGVLGGAAGIATVTVGALTVPAGAAIRSRFQLRSAIPVVGDEYVIVFGEGGPTDTLGGTTSIRSVTRVPRLAVSTGGDPYGILLHVWYPSNAVTPASWEVEVCWREIG